MFTKDQIKILKRKKKINHLNYLGILHDYERICIDKEIDYSKLNPKQHFLFKRVLHGYKVYDKKEFDDMHWDKKRRIIKVWKRSQDVINEWKQWICYNDSQKIFAIFKDSKLGNALYSEPFRFMVDYKNKFTLKELGITYDHVIIKFISKGLLPKNFMSIK